MSSDGTRALPFAMSRRRLTMGPIAPLTSLFCNRQCSGANQGMGASTQQHLLSQSSPATAKGLTRTRPPCPHFPCRGAGRRRGVSSEQPATLHAVHPNLMPVHRACASVALVWGLEMAALVVVQAGGGWPPPGALRARLELASLAMLWRRLYVY